MLQNINIVLKDSVILGTLDIVNGKINRIQETNGKSDLFIAPGIVDIHTHGCGGYDFMDNDPSDFENALNSLAKNGTTTCLATSMTSSDSDLFRFLDNANKTNNPVLAGLHLEGPYLSAEKSGAQAKDNLKIPEEKHYRQILERGNGLIKRWTVAPEIPNALPFIKYISKQGITASAGHTNATLDTIKESCKAGVSLLTHFYNAMSTITRDGSIKIPGTTEAGYLLDELNIEIICDGLHIPPDLLKMIFKCKDNNKIIAISDSMRAAGMPNGPYVLGNRETGVQVIAEDGIAKLQDRKTFAASVATGIHLVKTLASIGLSLPEIFRATSLNPAKLLNMENSIGSIQEGKDADLIVFDRSFNLVSVYKKGLLL